MTDWVGHKSIACVLCPVAPSSHHGLYTRTLHLPHAATCPVGNLCDSPALPLTGLNKQILVGYLWNEQPRAVETMAQVPPGTGTGGGGQTEEAAQNPGQGDSEVGVGLQAQVKLKAQSQSFLTGLGAGQGRGYLSSLYYTVKNSVQWLCGHEALTKGVDKVSTGNSSPGRSTRGWNARARGFPDRCLYRRGFGCSCRASWYCSSGAHSGSQLSCTALPSGTGDRRLIGKPGPLLPRTLVGSFQPR